MRTHPWSVSSFRSFLLTFALFIAVALAVPHTASAAPSPFAMKKQVAVDVGISNMPATITVHLYLNDGTAFAQITTPTYTMHAFLDGSPATNLIDSVAGPLANTPRITMTYMYSAAGTAIEDTRPLRAHPLRC